jgi:hypothetical protein
MNPSKHAVEGALGRCMSPGINRSDREFEARQLVGDDLPDDRVR